LSWVYAHYISSFKGVVGRGAKTKAKAIASLCLSVMVVGVAEFETMPKRLSTKLNVTMFQFLQL